MNPSSVGEAWRPYFEAESLSWYIPSQVNPDYILRFAQSDWIQKIIRLTRIKTAADVCVLEAGCGTALYALSFAILGFNAEAFDYNEEALVLARQVEEKARQVKPNLKIKLFRDNLLDIDLPDDSYDLVFNQAVLDYFCDPTQRARVLAEMQRVTKPGARVALIVQHTGHPFRPLWERMGWLGYDNQPPTTIQTPARLVREFREAGLQNVTVDGLYPWKAFFFYPAWYRRWKLTENAVYLIGQTLQRGVPLPRRLSAQLGLQFLVVGQKA